LVRGYGWLGKRGLTLWDEGAQTREERDLGFHFFNPSAICESPKRGSMGEGSGSFRVTKGPPAEGKRSDDRARDDLVVADETCVMQLASYWSIDPTTLNEEYKEPATGLLGSMPGMRADPVDRTGIAAFRGAKAT